MTESQPVKRRRGGQPGNINAVKHGLYIEGRSVRNTTPVERAQLFDLNEIISHLKDYINATYEKGLQNRTIDQYNETLRTLAMAAMGLSRLMNLHNQFHISGLPSDLVLTKKTTVMSLVDFYKKKTATILDLETMEDDIDDPCSEPS